MGASREKRKEISCRGQQNEGCIARMDSVVTMKSLNLGKGISRPVPFFDENDAVLWSLMDPLQPKNADAIAAGVARLRRQKDRLLDVLAELRRTYEGGLHCCKKGRLGQPWWMRHEKGCVYREAASVLQDFGEWG